MKKLPKIILTLLISCIIIVGGYFAATDYMNQMEQKHFNETIKKISDIENQSDSKNNKQLNVSKLSASEYSKINAGSKNTSDTETLMLQNLSKELKNETLKEYVDLEIERTSLESKLWDEEFKLYDAYNRYYKGQATLSDITDHREKTNTYGDEVGSKKLEVETYLNKNPEFKERLNNLNIDEDFIIQEYTNMTYPTVTRG